jgi:hypothetical protein
VSKKPGPVHQCASENKRLLITIFPIEEKEESLSKSTPLKIVSSVSPAIKEQDIVKNQYKKRWEGKLYPYKTGEM